MAIGFAGAIAVSRAVNYVRERRRPAPRSRSWGRRLYHAPRRNEARVHHFVPGIAMAFLTGALAILTRGGGHELRLSLPFGVGVGLTLDEAQLLGDLDNPYWGSQTFSLIQAAAAAAVASALAFRFQRRGAKQPSTKIVD